MKRKIAAIFAADIAGYSRLVAEDEEETLRRLASYREVIDDFIAKANGRIFNTAGDAVLAEFPSAVDAVRCAIDIQESLRTRNMAYPPSRQMSFRIGITIGDVVERNGDLLGDGVNIAARLEGLAEVGGICVSRAVHEQVANKLSVQFADIGEQEVKNIPTPVHAYMVAMRREDGTYSKPQLKKPASKLAAAPVWMWPLVVAIVSIVAIGVTGFLYNTKLKQTATAAVTPAATPSAAPSPTPTQIAKAPMTPMAPNASAAMAPMPAPSPSASPISGKFAADSVPFINERVRNYLAGDYAAAGDYKAFALNIGGFTGSALNQGERGGRAQRRARAVPEARRCRAIAAALRALCGRQHRGLHPRQAADAAAALGAARCHDRAAVRAEGLSDGARSPESPAREHVRAGGEIPLGRARPGRTIFHGTGRLVRRRRGAALPGIVRRDRGRRLPGRRDRRQFRRADPDPVQDHRLLQCRFQRFDRGGRA